MISLRSRSPARVESGDRLRFASGGQTLVFGLTVTLILLLMFPGQILQRRLGQSAAQDSLAVAYLTAWLRAKPDDHHLRIQLARQQFGAGQVLRAWTTLQPAVNADGLEAEDQYRMRLLQLDLLEHFLWTEDPMSLSFMRRQRDYVNLLGRLARSPLFNDRLEHFAARAEAIGEYRLARILHFRRIAGSKSPRQSWFEPLARLALADGQPAMAGRVLLMSLDLSESLETRRRVFLEALRHLQAANRHAEALRAAANHLGPLRRDPVTLEALARLALAANRPDIAEYYVSLLLRQRIQTPGADQ